MTEKRRPKGVSIAAASYGSSEDLATVLYALMDDGTIWVRYAGGDRGWDQLPSPSEEGHRS
jgi:hypothetical protein